MKPASPSPTCGGTPDGVKLAEDRCGEAVVSGSGVALAEENRRSSDRPSQARPFAAPPIVFLKSPVSVARGCTHQFHRPRGPEGTASSRGTTMSDHKVAYRAADRSRGFEGWPSA